MSAYSARLLVVWLLTAALAPGVVGVGEALGLLREGLVPVVTVAALLACVLGLIVFEPPRSPLSLRRWLARLRDRLLSPTPQSAQEK